MLPITVTVLLVVVYILVMNFKIIIDISMKIIV
jgi:hypothetical protein